MEKAAELRDLILSSDEYTKFENAREQLVKEEELFKKVNEFREKNFQFQTGGAAANESLVEKLVDEYSEVLGTRVVTEYMNAELVLCRKLQEVYELLVADIDLGLEFL